MRIAPDGEGRILASQQMMARARHQPALHGNGMEQMAFPVSGHALPRLRHVEEELPDVGKAIRGTTSANPG